MDNGTGSLVKALLIVFVGIPVVAGLATYLIVGTGTVIANAVEKRAWKKKIEEGLKNGTIIQDGDKYYEVTIVNATPI